MTAQPNILLIQVDQLAASFLPTYGNKVAKTPHLNALAERSVVFESAYTNFALCAPSRFSMLSGRLASEIGAFDNGAEFASSTPTFAHYLRAAGYHTSLVGKMHFVGADQLHGFQERLTTDIYPSGFSWTGDWTEATESHSNDIRTFTLAGPYLRTVQMDYDDEVAHRANRKLYDLARGDSLADLDGGAKQPWHVTVSFTHPHDPFQCRPEHWNLYNPDDIDMPVIGRTPDADTDPYSLRLREQYGLATFEPTDEQIRQARHGYYGSISYVDDLVGDLLATLADTGMDRNTVVVFTTDHGDMMGERGLWYKRSFFEGSSRIPLMISWPENFDAGRVGDNVSLVDLLPTFCDVAGRSDLAGAIDPLDGLSLVSLLQDGVDDGRGNTVYGENLSEGATAPVLMVKRGSLKYVMSGCDPEQLFDLSADPNEVTNLAGHAEYVDAQSQLRELAVAQWDMETLTIQVEESQRRRQFLRSVGNASGRPDWSHTPPDQAGQRVLRDGMVYNDWAYNLNLDVDSQR